MERDALLTSLMHVAHENPKVRGVLVPIIRKHAKDWIQNAVKRPGRVLELTGKKPGELTQADIDKKLSELESKKEKSDTDKQDIHALTMAKTLVKHKGWKGE